jgi:hypothetical protein
LCGESLRAKTKDGHGRPHGPGSDRCLAGFLGWDRHKVQDLLTLRDRLPKSIRAHVTERVGSTAEGRDDGTSLGRRTATVLASLATEKEGNHLQEVIYNAVKKAPARVTDDDMSRIVKTVKAAPQSQQVHVAKAEARKVVQEIQFRADPTPKSTGRTGKSQRKKKEPMDVIQFLAKQLNEMRRLVHNLGEILQIINDTQINIFVDPVYTKHIITMEFFHVARQLTEHLDLFRKLQRGKQSHKLQGTDRRSLHA